MTRLPALGILAGGGPLPGRVAAAAQAAGRAVFLVGFEGFAEPAVLAPFPHEFVRLGAAGRTLALLRAHGCRDLVLVGPVKRPSIFDLRPDVEGTRILARIGRAAFAGDDGLLAAVVRVLAEEGFHVVGAHEILTEAVGPRGQLGAESRRTRRRWPISVAALPSRARLAPSMSARAAWCSRASCCASRRSRAPMPCSAASCALARPGPGGVLVKLVKPGQDRRADLPTIGPRTVQAAAAAGLRGIAFEAGGTILTDRAALVREADTAGLFLVGIDPDSISFDGG